MRNHLAWTLLPILVVTLAVSNMLLAHKVVSLENEIPSLVAQLAYSVHPTATPRHTPMHTPMPVPTNNPIITELKPTTGKTGTLVTIKGKDFSPKDNLIILGKTFVVSAPSKDGETLRFTVPPRLVDCTGQGDSEICKILSTTALIGKTLPVWGKNAIGESNRISFTIKK